MTFPIVDEYFLVDFAAVKAVESSEILGCRVCGQTLPGASRLRDKDFTCLIQVLSEPSKILPGGKPSLGKRFQCACRNTLACDVYEVFHSDSTS